MGDPLDARCCAIEIFRKQLALTFSMPFEGSPMDNLDKFLGPHFGSTSGLSSTLHAAWNPAGGGVKRIEVFVGPLWDSSSCVKCASEVFRAITCWRGQDLMATCASWFVQGLGLQNIPVDILLLASGLLVMGNLLMLKGVRGVLFVSFLSYLFLSFVSFTPFIEETK